MAREEPEGGGLLKPSPANNRVNIFGIFALMTMLSSVTYNQIDCHLLAIELYMCVQLQTRRATCQYTPSAKIIFGVLLLKLCYLTHQPVSIGGLH